MYSLQFTPLVPQGNDTIQDDFQVESSQRSDSKVFKIFYCIKFIVGQAKKKKTEDKLSEVKY